MVFAVKETFSVTLCTYYTLVLSLLGDKHLIKIKLWSVPRLLPHLIPLWTFGWPLFLSLKRWTSEVCSMLNLPDSELFIKTSHFPVERFATPGLKTNQCEHAACHAVKSRKSGKIRSFFDSKIRESPTEYSGGCSEVCGWGLAAARAEGGDERELRVKNWFLQVRRDVWKCRASTGSQITGIFGKQQHSSVGSPWCFCNSASFWVGWDKALVGGWNLILEEKTRRNQLF